MSHGSARQEQGGLLQDVFERALASMQDLKDDTSLRTRSSASHEIHDCCPTRGQPCTPANPKPRQRKCTNAGWSEGLSLSESSASEQRCVVLVAWRRLSILALGMGAGMLTGRRCEQGDSDVSAAGQAWGL